jgi:predicted house-cleaning noncanonical NTP pyrophosphatase (MazG superfamily)
MLTFKFGKLVRDKIVAQQQASGAQPKYRQLNHEEHKTALIAKIIEEAQEILQAEPGAVAAEIADVQQAIDDLIEKLKLTVEEVKLAQEAKHDKNGGFADGTYIEHVAVDENDPWVAYYEQNSERYPRVD